MGIRNESTSTTELLRDTRYHRAALTEDPQTKDMTAPVKDCETHLRKKYDTHESAEDVRVEKLALFNRTDYVLGVHIRMCELEVLAQVGNNREDQRYTAVFTRAGAASIIDRRGADAAIAVKTMTGNLSQHFPDNATRHNTTLLAEAAATAAAENAWKQAEADAATAKEAEYLARRDLVRQLQKNEGTLQALFPGDKRRVRSYFRPQRRGTGTAATRANGGNTTGQ